jgi:hypothetical protein
MSSRRNYVLRIKFFGYQKQNNVCIKKIRIQVKQNIIK